jgi:hypothetical protein
MTIAAFPIVEAIEGISMVLFSNVTMVAEKRLVYSHIPTILPATLLPKERYPVIATRMYIKHAEPMLVAITEVVLVNYL